MAGAIAASLCFLIGLFWFVALMAAQSAPQEAVAAILGVGFWLLAAVLAGVERIRTTIKQQTEELARDGQRLR